jgi:serine protease Do
LAEAQGMAGQKGAIVSDLVPGGPSARAGLMQGDVVVAVNGVTVRTSSELTREVAKARPGDALHVEVVREGKRRTIEIRSGVRPSERDLASNDNTPGGGADRGSPTQPSRPSVLGMALSPLDGETRSKLNAPATLNGVLVESVDQSSDAGQKGLRRGDVIVRAGDRAVASAADLAAVVEAAKKANRTSVLVGVFRAGRTTFLPLKVSG